MSSRRVFASVLLACAFVAGGCGGDDDEDGASQAPPEARPDQFPRSEGRTLAQLRRDLPDGGPVLAPTVSHFVTGDNRFGFGLFTTSRAQIADARAAVYVAPAGGGQALGPFVAHYESLEVKPQFQSETTLQDPDAAKTLYVAEVPFRKPGNYEVLGMALLDDRLVAATSAAPQYVVVGSKQDSVPAPGDEPPPIHTPTEADVAGNLAEIDTRMPPSEIQHDADFADVIGKKPVVLTFATPLPVPEPRLRTGRGHRRAGPGRLRRPRRVHPDGDLQRTTTSPRATARRSRRSGCRRSRGCSPSTRTARSRLASRAPSAPPSWSGRSNRR